MGRLPTRRLPPASTPLICLTLQLGTIAVAVTPYSSIPPDVELDRKCPPMLVALPTYLRGFGVGNGEPFPHRGTIPIRNAELRSLVAGCVPLCGEDAVELAPFVRLIIS